MDDSCASWAAGVMRQLGDLARQLPGQRHREEVLERVVEAAVTFIEGAEHASVAIVEGLSVSTPVASSALAHAVDHHQYATGEGPCLITATEHERAVRVDDIRRDQRWPLFTAAVSDLGVRSILSFRLYTVAGGESVTIGALNIYAESPAAFTAKSVQTATLLAALAAAAAAAATKTDNLQTALVSRDSIGQAKGILMERFKLTPDQAFDLLIAASQHTHLKLRDIAERLNGTGELVTS